MSEQQALQQIALAAMENKAKSQGIQGVAANAIIDSETLRPFFPVVAIVGRFHRPPDPDKGANDTGANYLAVAFSKFAESLETRKPSGQTPDRQPKKGEFGYRGCVLAEKGGKTIFLLLQRRQPGPRRRNRSSRPRYFG